MPHNEAVKYERKGQGRATYRQCQRPMAALAPLPGCTSSTSSTSSFHTQLLSRAASAPGVCPSALPSQVGYGSLLKGKNLPGVPPEGPAIAYLRIMKLKFLLSSQAQKLTLAPL